MSASSGCSPKEEGKATGLPSPLLIVFDDPAVFQLIVPGAAEKELHVWSIQQRFLNESTNGFLLRFFSESIRDKNTHNFVIC